MNIPESVSENDETKIKGEEPNQQRVDQYRQSESHEKVNGEPEIFHPQARNETSQQFQQGAMPSQEGATHEEVLFDQIPTPIQNQENVNEALNSQQGTNQENKGCQDLSNSLVNSNLQSFHQLIEDVPEQGGVSLDNEDKKTEKSLVEYEYQQIPVEQFGDEDMISNEVDMKKKDEGENHEFYGMEEEQPAKQDNKGTVQIGDKVEEISQEVVESEPIIQTQAKDIEGIPTQTENEAATEETQTTKSLMKESEGKGVPTQTDNQVIAEETQTSKSLMKKEVEGNVVITQTESQTVAEETQTSKSLMKEEKVNEQETQKLNQIKQNNEVARQIERQPKETVRKFPSLFYQEVPGIVSQRKYTDDSVEQPSCYEQKKEVEFQNKPESSLIKQQKKTQQEERRETVIRKVQIGSTTPEPDQKQSKKEETEVKHKKKKKKHRSSNLIDKKEKKHNEAHEKIRKQVQPREPNDDSNPPKKVQEQTSESINNLSVPPPQRQPQPEPQLIDPVLVRPMSQQDEPPLTSQIIANEAYKERMGSTYFIFTKYVTKYTKALNFYKQIVENINSQIQKRKNQKLNLLTLLTQYLQGYARSYRQFNEKVYSLQYHELPTSNNPLGNIKLQLGEGYNSLLNLRKAVANQSHKMNIFTCNIIINKIKTVFSVYFQKINLEQQRHQERRTQHSAREKTFYKVISQVQKVFRKGMEGKFKVDILSQQARFVNEEITHRGFLKTYGKGILPLRKIYKQAENQLFISLQQILNQLKTQSKAIYSVGRRVYDFVQDLSGIIKSTTKIEDLSPLTDIDYIRYVLQIQQKKEPRQFKTHHFESFLELIYWDRLVGNIRDVYKGAICKIFPMTVPHEELIHTISGNLVHFNRDTDQVLNIFKVRNINVRIIGEGTLQFDELLEGIIFNDNRTVRIKLKDSDRAEELICYLDQKENDFVVETRPVSLQ